MIKHPFFLAFSFFIPVICLTTLRSIHLPGSNNPERILEISTASNNNSIISLKNDLDNFLVTVNFTNFQGSSSYDMLILISSPFPFLNQNCQQLKKIDDVYISQLLSSSSGTPYNLSLSWFHVSILQTLGTSTVFAVDYPMLSSYFPGNLLQDCSDFPPNYIRTSAAYGGFPVGQENIYSIWVNPTGSTAEIILAFDEQKADLTQPYITLPAIGLPYWHVRIATIALGEWNYTESSTIVFDLQVEGIILASDFYTSVVNYLQTLKNWNCSTSSATNCSYTGNLDDLPSLKIYPATGNVITIPPFAYITKSANLSYYILPVTQSSFFTVLGWKVMSNFYTVFNNTDLSAPTITLYTVANNQGPETNTENSSGGQHYFIHVIVVTLAVVLILFFYRRRRQRQLAVEASLMLSERATKPATDVSVYQPRQYSVDKVAEYRHPVA